MNLFYAPLLTKNEEIYHFDKDESRHITKSLRKRVGDKLFLTNGLGDWFEAEIMLADAKKTTVKITSVAHKPAKPYQLHIAIAPTKNNDRYEWFLEKATEIGIDEITPLITRYSERKVIKKERFDKILVSAMKQSLQAYKPQLNDLVTFDKFLEKKFDGTQKFIAYCQAEQSLMSQIIPQKDTLILIGPEGGFSDIELQRAVAAGFQPVSLSTNRLRTETAGLLSVAAVNLKNNE
jgi:16S rRNA (uracil1498-N3)-methyltransferase